jgi:predicted AAA+ superfamily ATPase
MGSNSKEEFLQRIAEALERMAPPRPDGADLNSGEAFVWHADIGILERLERVNRLPLALLLGLDLQRDQLLENTRRFAAGLPANNALLWGARGMGKSSLVKAVHAEVNGETKGALALVEIHREDIDSLPGLLALLRASGRLTILFCDDLSFEEGEVDYKALKAVLEGGIEGRPENVIFYATSNRRHLMARSMIDNEQSTAINPSEAVEEKVSLSDRFGLWLGFHACDQRTYLAMIDAYAAAYDIAADPKDLHAQANEWSITRGARSGRVAWQFIQDLAGRQGRRLT